MLIVAPGPGVLFDDHAPQLYVGAVGIGESWFWNDLLITTVGCGFIAVAEVPHAVASSITRKTDPNVRKRNLFIIFFVIFIELFCQMKNSSTSSREYPCDLL